MEPIAIVGLSYKLPEDAENDYSFWDSLEKGRNLSRPWPKSRVNVDAFLRSNIVQDNTLYSKGAHFIREDPAAFDAAFFSITSKEAASMDPQQRWLLETTYRALENVFAASMADDYMRILAKDPDEAPTNTATGTSPSILANRLSWYFDFQGPSIQLNTACSTSMIAMDLACQSLRGGQSSMALVAGSNVLLSIETSLYLSNMKMLSPDSVCYSFDDRANGYARGEGVVVFVLKKLSDAIRDADVIRAVIRATGSNQDGHTPGITQPNAKAQEQLIRQVYKSCNLGFESTRYVEAHGTGTQIGDATEMKSIGRTFRSSRSQKEPLYVGSVKANIGHLEGGSGLAGILKCVMMLEKGVIPPNPLFEKMNPKINAWFYNVQVPTKCIPWPSDGLRRISVNSFGFGGSNGHIILDDAYHTLRSMGLEGFHNTLVPSSPSKPQTNGSKHHMGYDNDNDDKRLATGTDPVPTSSPEPVGAIYNKISTSKGYNYADPQTHSLGCVAQLPRGSSGKPTIDNPTSPRSDSVMSTQHASLSTSADSSTLGFPSPRGVQLLVWSARDEAALRRTIHQYTEYFGKSISNSEEQLDRLAYTLANRRDFMTWRAFAVVDANESPKTISASTATSIRSSRETGIAFIFTGQGAQYAKMGLELLRYPVFNSTLSRTNQVFRTLGAEWSIFDEIELGENINEPHLSQPLCTALQIALVDLLRSFGIGPLAVIGHSSGEIAAAYSVGALSLESACKVAYHRGRLASQLVASLPRPGAMISVNLPESDVPAHLAKIPLTSNVHVACVNSPFNVTLSGDETDIDALKEHLNGDGIFAQKLKTGVAYHSPSMHAVSAEYLASMGTLQRGKPADSVFMVSSVTGTVVDPDALCEGSYWVSNLVSPVRFTDALRYLAVTAPKLNRKHAVHDFLEVGPHGALRRPSNDTLGHYATKKRARYTSLLSKFESPLKTTLETIGRFFTYGYALSLSAANLQDTHSKSPQILVDLPEYPFDHSQTYWHETRLSREWAMRKSAPRSILGICATDWNSAEPRWRKMLSLDETPWLADHVVGENALFPATGMIMMVLEAVKQHFQTDQTISGFNVKEMTFMNPIIVGAGPQGKTEVVTQLRPHQQAYEKTSTRSEVRIFSRADSDWTECVRAEVHVEYEDTATEVDGGRELRAHAKALLDSYVIAEEQCKRHVSKTDFYNWHQEQGLRYGEAFSLADNIYWDGEELGIARVDVSAPTHSFEGIVHPAVLDAACQVCFTAPSTGMSSKLPTIIPHKIYNAWISASGWQHPHTSHIRMLTRSKFKATVKGIESSFMAIADDGSPLCHVSRLEMLPVLGNDSTNESERKLLHGLDWKPQLSMLDTNQLREYCKVDHFPDDESVQVQYFLELERTIRTVVHRNLDRLKDTDWTTAPSHMKKYVSWLEQHIERVPGLPENEVSDEELSKKLNQLREQRPDWRMFIEIAENLVSIVRGDIDTLEMLFASTLAQDAYDALFSQMYNHKFISYLGLVAHQNPTQKILEVGAGTGAMTDRILSTLHDIEIRTGGTAFSSYTYTDISPGFFEKARERFSEYQDRMVFKTLDLESDTGEQGFEAGIYDIILAGSVIHATKNLAATLKNLRRALKPGGKLIFHETTASDCFVMNFGFGILAGWWLSEEDFRAWGPTITEPEWDHMLRENGFSGNDLIIRDYKEDAAHYCSVIFTTAVNDSQEISETGKTIFVVDENNKSQIEQAANLAPSNVLLSSFATEVLPITEVGTTQVSRGDFVVFLADMSGELLTSPSEASLQLIRDWVYKSDNLLWVTSANISDNLAPIPYPHAGLKDGFLRTLRAEFTNKRIMTLSLEGSRHDLATNSAYIWKVLDEAISAHSPELEYVLRDGQLMTGRLIEEDALNKDLGSSVLPQMQTETWLPGPPLKLEIGSRGSLETLHFTEDMEQYAPLGAQEVEIEAKAWGLNFRDMFQALGRLEEDTFGSDCAGIVTRVGSACTKFQPGDRVCICGGEKILIHAASGATGQLAIQIAKMVGAEVFVTVGFDYKKQHLIDQYGIPADHIFYSRNTTFAKGIMRVTNGYGVDVVLNSLVGEGLRASWECVAPYGRFIEIGKVDINANSSLPMACFANNVSFFAVDLRHIAFHRKEMGRNLLHKTMELVAEGKIHCPKPLNFFPVSAIESAFRYMQSGKNTGRIIIQIDPSAEKRVLRRRLWQFDQNASYFVAGGLGGIGRSILKWMASKGARNLIVPSRSGAKSDAASKLVSELAEKGVNVTTPICDVSNAESLSELVNACAKTMPLIRGCINATMVLNDSTFDNMASLQWAQTIRSKVHSSWNLHTLLPQDLDFFILLSSIAGVIGNIGQSNYGAGCTFQDALARYRVQHKQRATSVDLGLMRTIGIVAETERLHDNFKGSKSLGQIEENEFLALLDIYCDPNRADTLLTPGKCQVAVGLVTPADMLARDEEPVEILQRPLFAAFSQARGISHSTVQNTTSPAASFHAAETDEQRALIVVEALARKLARALSIAPEDVDVDKPLHAFGVDSLVAVELRNWIGKEFAADVAVFDIMRGRTVAAIGELITKMSQVRRAKGKVNVEEGVDA
ncbi:polyketide synthase PksD [Ophiobolus disseminans]|uniref:Polyketide synthase PksD n=1 Tax=Ophiobolus disseminans TaxID=1469910 RepID=A0A6A7A901_9PLEO|nr:polyketide synthase PksD [Ophiobolus disseminans]